MQRLSIVVPLMGNLQRFEDTLVSVLENRPERSEVVVVTNGPYDDPYALRGEVVFIEAPRGASLLQCFAAGLAASRAAVVHLIAAGVEATPGWSEAALARFAERDVAAVAPVVVDRDRPQRILSAGLRYTRAGAIRRICAGRLMGSFAAGELMLCGPELLCAFYRREALAKIESLPNYSCPQAAAIELGFALRRAGHRCVCEPQSLTMLERRGGRSLQAAGELFADRGGWREGVARERLFQRRPSEPETKQSRLAHVALIAGEALQVPLGPWLLGRVAGRAWAAMGFGAAKDVAIGEHAVSRRPSSSACPSQFAAADSRAA